MKKRKWISLITAVFLLLAMLTGCGAEAPEAAMDQPNAMLQEASAEDGLYADTKAAGTVLPENRKWVVTVSLHAETEDLDTLLAGIFQQVEDLNGYVEDQNIQNGTAYAARRYRSASLTVRVPADRVDQFTDQMSQQANLVSNTKSLEDITLQYTDTETRLKALEIEEARLMELLEQAETMSDLLEIEERLTEVRYEKESVTSRLRTYDNQVDYATVYLQIEEVLEYTPVEKPTVWERISGGFLDSLRGVGLGILDFFVWVLASSPYLLIWGGIIALAVVLIRKWRKHRKQKKQGLPPKKDEKQES